MRLNFQKRSELKVVSRIIPEAKRSGIVRLADYRKRKSNYPIACGYLELSPKRSTLKGIYDAAGYFLDRQAWLPYAHLK